MFEKKDGVVIVVSCKVCKRIIITIFGEKKCGCN